VDRERYEAEMQRAAAKILIEDRLDYWQGYQKGLQRRYHGEQVVSTAEHLVWLNYLSNMATRNKGKGYFDGLLV
jgi:hypothetical protein